MRTFETLVREYPEKTGAEIMQIVEQEKKAEANRILESHKSEFETIRDYNTNGAYFKGTFGLDQYFVYKIENARLMEDKMVGDVTSITGFRHGGKIEKSSRTWQDLSKYGIGVLDRITEKEFNEVDQYIDAMYEKFFTIIGSPTKVYENGTEIGSQG